MNTNKMNYIIIILFSLVLLRLGQANPVIKAHHQLNVPYQIPQKNPQDLRLDDFSQQLSEEQIHKAIHDVRITINEVQRRLAMDPNMPRLTKGEIEELFENVTREELNRSIHMGDHRREKHMRALMLVLPYHAKDVTSEKIQQLYTKKPLTQLMNNIPAAQTTNLPAFRPLASRSTTSTSTTTTSTAIPVTAVPSMQRYPPIPVEPFGLRDSIIPQKGQPGPFVMQTEPPKPPQKLHKKVPSQLTIAQRGKVNVASISITRAPLFETTTKKPTRNPQSVFEILQAIGLHQEKVKAANMATSTTTSTTSTTPKPSTTTEMSDEMKRLLIDFGFYQQEQRIPNDIPFVPDVQYEPQYSFSVQNPGFGVGVDDFQPLPIINPVYQGPVYPGYTDFEIENESSASGSEKVHVTVKAPENIAPPETTTGTTSTTTTTTTTTTTQKPQITKPKVNKPTDFLNFRPIPEDNPKSISEDFQNILRQFGLLGGESTPTKTRIPKRQKTETTSEKSTTTTTTTTTEIPMKYMPDIINIPLPSDMMAVLQNLGVSTESPIAIKVQMPSSSRPLYSTRLPTSSINSKISQKTTIVEASKVESTTPDNQESNSEVIKTTSSNASGFFKPTEMKTTTIGTSKRRSSMRPIVVGEIPMEKPRKIESYSRTNIFKPTTSAKHTTKDDFKKLEHLLETIKELDKLNTTLTPQHLDKLDLNKFNFSDSLLHEGPDPVSFFPQSSHPLKNEIKRQEPKEEDNKKDNPTKISLDLNESDSPKIMVVNAVKASDELSEEGTTFAPLNQITEETTDDDEEKDDGTTTTTTEEGRSASADELKDSFPNDTDPDEPIDETLPLPRRNGFYFLADWNSFLEVGQDEEQVVVRFDPKIGDPSRFLPVHIPSKTS